MTFFSLSPIAAVAVKALQSPRVTRGPPEMILVAIFSIIVLLMCWLCYHGDVNN